MYQNDSWQFVNVPTQNKSPNVILLMIGSFVLGVVPGMVCGALIAFWRYKSES